MPDSETGIERRVVQRECFNQAALLPYELRPLDFDAAMQDVYDFFFDVNQFLTSRGLKRLEETLRKAILSGVLSDMLTASMAAHSRTLVENQHHNGHPDLIVKGAYRDDAVKSGSEGLRSRPPSAAVAPSIRTERATSGWASSSTSWT